MHRTGYAGAQVGPGDQATTRAHEALIARWPILASCIEADRWLSIQTDRGLAPRTLEAYARGLADLFRVCHRDGIDPLTAGRAEIARYVRDLAHCPSRRGPNVRWSR